MRWICSGILIGIIVTSPVVEAFNRAIFTPHTQQRVFRHSKSKSERVIEVKTDRYIRRIPRNVKRKKHALTGRKPTYEVTDVKFIEGQRTATTGTYDPNALRSVRDGEHSTFGQDYGNRRNEVIENSRTNRRTITAKIDPPLKIRKVKKQVSREQAMENTFWYGPQHRKERKPYHALKPDPEINRFSASAPKNSAGSGTFPSGAKYRLSAKNIDRGRLDATINPIGVGEYLLVELEFESKSQGVFDFEPSVNIANIMDRADIVNIEKGFQRAHYVIFNKFSLSPPFLRNFRFYVEVEKCDPENPNLVFTAEGTSLEIPMRDCGEELQSEE